MTLHSIFENQCYQNVYPFVYVYVFYARGGKVVCNLQQNYETDFVIFLSLSFIFLVYRL